MVTFGKTCQPAFCPGIRGSTWWCIPPTTLCSDVAGDGVASGASLQANVPFKDNEGMKMQRMTETEINNVIAKEADPWNMASSLKALLYKALDRLDYRTANDWSQIKKSYMVSFAREWEPEELR